MCVFVQDAYVLCRVFKKNGFGPGKNPRNGLDEQVDNADSPSEEMNPAFLEYEVKPSLDLPPPPPPTAKQPPPTAISLGDSLAAAAQLPLTAVPLSVGPPLAPTANVEAWGPDFELDTYAFPQVSLSERLPRTGNESLRSGLLRRLSSMEDNAGVPHPGVRRH